jgi:DNA polymerase III alpha subunit
VNPRAVNKRVLESLAASGAFDVLEPNRARSFAAVDIVLAAAQRAHDNAALGQNELFGGPAAKEPLALPVLEPWLPAERLQKEYDAIGFFLTGHPLDDYAAASRAVVDRIRPRGEGRRRRRPRRRHRGVAHRAPHQERHQDGHHRPVRCQRPLRGGAVRRRLGAIS